MIVLPLLLLLHSFQGFGYCGPVINPVASAVISAPAPALPDDKMHSGNHQVLLLDGVGMTTQVEHQLQQGTIDQDEEQSSGSSSSLMRQRRHIGSIAQFRGLPGPFNKFQGSLERPLPDRKLMNEDEDVNKDKRYPELSKPFAAPHRPNPVMMRNPQPPPTSPVVVEEPTNPRTELRARAVTRLLRLLAESKIRNDPLTATSISKKFLGALARNNAMPITPPRALPANGGIQYKGSMAIPLPGKRSALADEWANGLDNEEEYYYDEDVDPSLLEEYDDNMIDLMKRHISSVAKSAKAGFLRQQRDYNRLPFISSY